MDTVAQHATSLQLLISFHHPLTEKLALESRGGAESEHLLSPGLGLCCSLGWKFEEMTLESWKGEGEGERQGVQRMCRGCGQRGAGIKASPEL